MNEIVITPAMSAAGVEALSLADDTPARSVTVSGRMGGK
jgi:hypothetical protein